MLIEVRLRAVEVLLAEIVVTIFRTRKHVVGELVVDAGSKRPAVDHLLFVVVATRRWARVSNPDRRLYLDLFSFIFL